MKLTKEQLAEFDEQGYLFLPEWDQMEYMMAFIVYGVLMMTVVWFYESKK